MGIPLIAQHVKHIPIKINHVYRKSVKNSIAQVVAVVAKHDLPTNSWPQLLQFLGASCKSTTLVEREVIMLALNFCSRNKYLCFKL